MSTEIAVLRALLRLSRHSGRRAAGVPAAPAAPAAHATLEELVARVREDAADVDLALCSLMRAQLVVRGPQTAPGTVRLSLAGLAVAVAATAAQARSNREGAQRATATVHSSARVFPILRRRRAA